MKILPFAKRKKRRVPTEKYGAIYQENQQLITFSSGKLICSRITS